jgi:hypothetical protein
MAAKRHRRQLYQIRVLLAFETTDKYRGSSVIGVSYEPSYSAFESRSAAKVTKNGEQISNRGRKIFGSFVPDVDVFSISMALRIT